MRNINCFFISEGKVPAWDIFVKSIENLATLMVYYVHHQKFSVNPEFSEESIVLLLKAYIDQHEIIWKSS